MGNAPEFDAEARAEFDEAVKWYFERSEGAAIGFISAVDLAIDRIVADPDRFPRTYAGCQRCMLHRYPYSVVFYRREGKLVIVAIPHAKRHPAYWSAVGGSRTETRDLPEGECR
jgi:plasmid stabilization system protein ParE